VSVPRRRTTSRRLLPNDLVVLRSSKQANFRAGADRLTILEGLGPDWLDLAEHAIGQARGRAVLRVQRDVLEPLCGHSSVASLVALADSDPTADEVRAALWAVLEEDGAKSQRARANELRFSARMAEEDYHESAGGP
jgi:hypothetical protein